MLFLLKHTFALIILIGVAGTVRSDEWASLERQGNQHRLAGDFDQADAIQQQLIRTYDVPVGHVFALNTIVTHLTWEERQTTYDDELVRHTERIFEWCTPRLKQDGADARANYYCGQAHFALSYLNGLRGNYYRAGTHGTRSIEFLESAIASDPELVDPKMFLGVAYYIADNLPPFIRMFSRLLWFIPTGNSEKSLPYIRDVMVSGDLYPDVARYLYSFLLIEGDPELRPMAVTHLQELVDRYPRNPRFQLRLISLLLIEGQFEATLETARRYLEIEPPPDGQEAGLARMWMARAYLETGQVARADELHRQLAPLLGSDEEGLPDWSRAWYLLTEAQLLDLSSRRDEALAAYRSIIEIGRDGYLNDGIRAAAQQGLRIPFSLALPAS